MTAREFKKVFPDEYGAWAMWIVPFLTGAQLAHTWNWKTLFWFLFLTVFYILKNPFVEWVIKNPVFSRNCPGKRGMIAISLAFPLAGLFGGAWFFAVAQRNAAFTAAGVAVILGTVYLFLDIHKLGRSLFGQWVGVFLLSLAAPLTAVALGGVFNRAAVAVWLANSLYFAHSIYTVRGWMNSRRRDGKTLSPLILFRPLFIYWGLTLLLAAVALLRHWISPSWWLLLVPTTLFIGTFVGYFYRRVSIRQIGFLEVAHTTLFAVLFLAVL